ncbi:hypothetical protein [Chitinophaga caseinilytica]|uniref:hypothetical protein n=1 Tax=Chitinophaga caseinilytica TaxID=2267521 RepID=UPI003C2DEEED
MPKMPRPYVLTGILMTLFLIHFFIFGYSPLYEPGPAVINNLWLIVIWLGVWTHILYLDRKANYIPSWALRLPYWYAGMRAISFTLVIKAELSVPGRWSMLVFNLLFLVSNVPMFIWWGVVFYYQRRQRAIRARRRANQVKR